MFPAVPTAGESFLYCVCNMIAPKFATGIKSQKRE